MGYGETQLERWGYGMAVSLILVGIFLLIMSSMSISYAKTGTMQESSLVGAAGFFIVISLVAMAIAGYAVYKIRKLHQLYLNVSSKAGTGIIKLEQKKQYPPTAVQQTSNSPAKVQQTSNSPAKVQQTSNSPSKVPQQSNSPAKIQQQTSNSPTTVQKLGNYDFL